MPLRLQPLNFLALESGGTQRRLDHLALRPDRTQGVLVERLLGLSLSQLNWMGSRCKPHHGRNDGGLADGFAARRRSSLFGLTIKGLGLETRGKFGSLGAGRVRTLDSAGIPVPGRLAAT